MVAGGSEGEIRDVARSLSRMYGTDVRKYQRVDYSRVDGSL